MPCAAAWTDAFSRPSIELGNMEFPDTSACAVAAGKPEGYPPKPMQYASASALDAPDELLFGWAQLIPESDTAPVACVKGAASAEVIKIPKMGIITSRI